MIQDPALYHIPPQALEAEDSILSACLIDTGSAVDAADLLLPDDFYKTAHQLIFKRITEAISLKKPTDLPSIVESLRTNNELETAGGAAYVASLVNEVPVAGNVKHYCSVVKAKKDLRRLIEQCAAGMKSAYNEDKDAIDRHHQKITEIAMGQKEGGFTHISEIIEETIDRCELLAKGRKVTGVPTGYPKLDYLTAGLQPTDLIILGGRPSMGKTAMALNIIKNMCHAGKKCAFFSLEMADPQIGNRLLAMESEVNSIKFRAGGFKDADWQRIMIAAGDMIKWELHVDDTAKLTYQGLIRRARQLHTQVGLDAIFIDYLGFVDGDKDAGRRDLEVGSITRNLKAFAKDAKLPIVLLVQLNRGLENRSDKRPKLSDLRDSGDIEQDSDIVMFMYRDEVYNENSPDKGKAELIMRKQRNGPIDTVPLRWDAKTTVFTTLNPEGYYGD